MKAKERELTMAISILPVLADYLEDQAFNQMTKLKTNNLISMIRSLDRYFMDIASVEAIEEQHTIALWFRNEVKKMQ
jgi:hypothetical protein